MHVGFIHGVMNTDNCSVSGETIDYGPCAFMDEYNPGAVFSSIDQMGRYAYANQPRIAVWNLARLAETLLPLLHENEEAAMDSANESLAGFGRVFEPAYFGGLRARIGLTAEQDGDTRLVNDLLQTMADGGADFTRVFRLLADAVAGGTAVRDEFADPAAFDAWAVRWRWRLGDEPRDPAAIRETMRAVSPEFIPRNHLVEAALAAAAAGDFAPFEELTTVLSRPFDDQPGFERYTRSPLPDQRVRATFCGT